MDWTTSVPFCLTGSSPFQLVSSGRNLVRYDMVAMKGREAKKLRCVFMLSDQLVLTSVKRKVPAKNGRLM